MASFFWVKNRLHDPSRAILASMIIIMLAWAAILLIPSHHVWDYPLSHCRVFGSASLGLSLFGMFSLSVSSLPIRALSLVGMSIATGLIACLSLDISASYLDCVVYGVLTLQSWWAIWTLPRSQRGDGGGYAA